jgi:hypothetical protein
LDEEAGPLKKCLQKSMRLLDAHAAEADSNVDDF